MQAIASVEKISERYLIPALEPLLEAYPFAVLGFHSDNGSEFVNRQVAALLDKLRAEFTPSRPRQSNDNALAECKNGHVIRQALRPSPHRPALGAGDQRVQPRAPQPVPQLPPPLPVPRNVRGPQRETTQTLPLRIAHDGPTKNSSPCRALRPT